MDRKRPLVLSLFPGIGLLDMAFEEEGFCVVRGPDLLWGGDIHRFHPPAGKFDGVIGGPPCKRWSPLANIVRAVHGEDSVAPDLIPEFERVVEEAAPTWFLMENVPEAPKPEVPSYAVIDQLVRDIWCGGKTNRMRRFSFGSLIACNIFDTPSNNFFIKTLALHATEAKPTVTTNSGGRRKVIAYDAHGHVRGKQGHADDARLKWRPLAEMAADQGVPASFISRLQEHGAFTTKALRIAIGNGVPLAMALAVAKAVKRAISFESGERILEAEGMMFEEASIEEVR